MDTVDLGNTNYNELYKLHAGHALYESDSDSSDSVASSTFFETNKPPLYSYEEIKANLDSNETQNIQSHERVLNVSGPNGANKTLKTDSCLREIVKKELEKLVLRNSCVLCNLIQRSEHDITIHKNGRSHKQVIDQYIKSRLEKLQSEINVEQTYKIGLIQSSSSGSNTSSPSRLVANSARNLRQCDPLLRGIIKRELGKLILRNSCILCNIIDRSEHDIENHKNGKTHKQVVDQFINRRLEKLKRTRNVEQVYCNDSLQSKYPNSNAGTPEKLVTNATLFKPSTAKKSLEDKRQIKLKTLMLPTYCYICYANLSQPGNAFSHYNSARHKNNVKDWKEESPIDLIQEKLDILMHPHYCYLCRADLPQGDQAQSHYNSKRHQNNVEIWTTTELEKLPPYKLTSLVSQAAGQSVNQTNEFRNVVDNVASKVGPFCMVCGINVETRLQDHYETNLHKGNVETMCFICNVKFASKEELAEHVKNIWHKKKLEQKNKDSASLALPQKIVTPVTKKAENLKESLIQNTQSSSQINVENSQTLKVPTSLKSIPQRWCYCDICKVALNGTDKAETHYKEVSHISKCISFYCHICKLSFGSKSEMDQHIESFPHSEISKLKSLVVSQGISTQEFWDRCESQLAIWCRLCGVSMQARSTAAAHLASSRHRNSFVTWCAQQTKELKDPNRRWHFCDLCKEPLDGTTYVEYHYQGTKHAEQYEKQLNKQQIKVQDRTIDVTKKETKDAREIASSATGNYLDVNNRETPKQKCSEDSDCTRTNNTANNFYCYACKVKLSGSVEVSLHIKSFPHNFVAKLKSLAVSKGIATQFWGNGRENGQFTMWCSMCQASLQNELSAQSHLNSLRHTAKLQKWYQEQPINTKDPNGKWHYCDICNLPLDGTTNAEQHYRGLTHAAKQKEHTERSQRSTSNNIPETDSASVSNSPGCSYMETNKNYGKLSTSEEIKNEDGKYLLELVRSEVEKLKNVVKSIPSDTAIKFLENYIQELENLREETRATASTVNVKNVVQTKQDGKSDVENKSVNRNTRNTNTLEYNYEERRYVLPPNLNQRNEVQSEAYTLPISNLLTLGAAGILFLYCLKK